MNERMVIVGAGQAGLQIAESLRAEGFDGAIDTAGGREVATLSATAAVKSMAAG